MRAKSTIRDRIIIVIIVISCEIQLGAAQVLTEIHENKLDGHFFF